METETDKAEIDLKSLSTEQRQRLMEEARQLEREAQAKRAQHEKAYRKLVDDRVQLTLETLFGFSKKMSELKQAIYGDFEDVFAQKKNLWKRADKNHSHTFTTQDGKYRITLGYNMNDSYADTVDVGIAGVREYIQNLAQDMKGKELAAMVLQLLAKDKTGNLKASRVMQLWQIAQKSGDVDFIESVKTIQDAYQSLRSKRYIRAWRKVEQHEWVAIPLNFTDV